MYSKAVLIFTVIFLLFSCAQVGTITGGKTDEIAPQITKSNLQNEQTNFNEKVIFFTFNEFVQLNNPSVNISLMPEDSKITSKLSKKTLTLTFSEDLRPNTTYLLYLNGAVKDVSEGNDTLFTYAFSTGNQLDSAKIAFQVNDALSQQGVKAYLVGLYDSLNQEKPRYYGRTNDKGFFQFSNVKYGEYFVQSFEDKDKDLKILPTENQGLLFAKTETNSDTLKLTLSQPEASVKVRNAAIIPPGLIGINLNERADLSRLSINGKTLNESDFHRINKDSLHLKIDTSNTEQLLIFENDTTRLLKSEKQAKQKLRAKAGKWENVVVGMDKIELNDVIENIDLSKINLKSVTDSSNVEFEVNKLFHELIIVPKNGKSGEMILSLKDSAILSKTDKYTSLTEIKLTILSSKDVGTLIVEMDSISDIFLLQLERNNKVIAVLPVQSKLEIPNLIPGDYTFKLIEDSNQNGKWDPLNRELRTQPERIIPLRKTTKVRANWETGIKILLSDLPQDE
jgi:uncharacterized protein (DUF2141 family)